MTPDVWPLSLEHMCFKAFIHNFFLINDYPEPYFYSEKFIYVINFLFALELMVCLIYFPHNVHMSTEIKHVSACLRFLPIIAEPTCWFLTQSKTKDKLARSTFSKCPQKYSRPLGSPLGIFLLFNPFIYKELSNWLSSSIKQKTDLFFYTLMYTVLKCITFPVVFGINVQLRTFSDPWSEYH